MQIGTLSGARGEGATSPTEEHTLDEAASDVSQVPQPDPEEIQQYEEYQQYVRGIVKKWLEREEDKQNTKEAKQGKPKPHNQLTHFLVMIAMASFLQVAKDAVKTVYRKLHGHRLNYYEDASFLAIEKLEMKKFKQHSRLSFVWKFLVSIGVQNFQPEEPENIETWKTFLQADQVFQLMQYLFDTCWKSEPDKNLALDRHFQLWEHYYVYWDWCRHLLLINVQNIGLTKPYPSCWTWDGFMTIEKWKLVEQAVVLYRRKIACAESLSWRHTSVFAA